MAKRFTVDQIQDRQSDPYTLIHEFLNEYSTKRTREEMKEGMYHICHATVDNYMTWLVLSGKGHRDKLRQYLNKIDKVIEECNEEGLEYNDENSGKFLMKIDDMYIGQDLAQEYSKNSEDNISGDIINAENKEDDGLIVEVGNVYDKEWNLVGKIVTPDMIEKEEKEKVRKNRRQSRIIKE